MQKQLQKYRVADHFHKCSIFGGWNIDLLYFSWQHTHNFPSTFIFKTQIGLGQIPKLLLKVDTLLDNVKSKIPWILGLDGFDLSIPQSPNYLPKQEHFLLSFNGGFKFKYQWNTTDKMNKYQRFYILLFVNSVKCIYLFIWKVRFIL